MTRVVVTGGFGYVGGRLVQALLAENLDVGVSTRRTPGQVPPWAKDRVQWGSDLDALCAGTDSLIHLAAPNETLAAATPERAISDTVQLTDQAIAAARKAGVGRFIYFSTVHVYGRLAGHITEQTPTAPVHPYAVAHLQSEQRVRDAAGDNLQALVLRLSNGFGAPADTGADRWTLLVNDLCRQAVCEGSLTLNSSGLQWRDFIPLSDVTRALTFLLKAPQSAPCETINLCRGSSLTVGQMAALILDRARLLIDPEMLLHISPSEASPDTPALEIDNQRLLQTDFRLKAPLEQEIDGLLRFCMDAWPVGR